jgi:hypothetical protein
MNIKVSAVFRITKQGIYIIQVNRSNKRKRKIIPGLHYLNTKSLRLMLERQCSWIVLNHC